MKILFIFSACFFITTCFGQQQIPKDNHSSRIYLSTNGATLTRKINQKDFITIVDGIRVEDKEFPKKIKINSSRSLGDTLKLKRLGITYFEKPYMFLSSFASDVRQLIYSKANINYELQEINLPIILNDDLITFSKYSLVDNLDTSQISTVRYIKPGSKFSTQNLKMPLGVIQVTADIKR
jgi:hypothetical protein